MAKGFLIRLPDDPEPPSGTWEHSLRMDKSQFQLAETCISFLMLSNSEETLGWNERTTNDEVCQYANEYKFLGYAGRYWGRHLSKSGTHLKITMLKQIDTLLEAPLPHFQTWFRIYRGF